MNWLDIAIVVVVAGFVFAAYSSGLIREVITLISVIVGVVLAGQLYDRLAADVLVFMDDRDVAEVISFLVLFGAVYLFGQIAYMKAGASLDAGLGNPSGAFSGDQGALVVKLRIVRREFSDWTARRVARTRAFGRRGLRADHPPPTDDRVPPSS
jgi:hypothetical protein